MKADKLIQQRFSELAEKAQAVNSTECIDGGQYVVDVEKYHEWATSALSLVKSVFGDSSPHYQNLVKAYDGSTYAHTFRKCKGIFQAAKEDYESGYLFTVRGLIKAEDTTDVLDQATEFLAAGFKDPACAVAGVALELALKELCDRNGVPRGKLDAMNVELCKKSVYNVGMQKQITTWAHWRNKAAHGEWGEYKGADVDDMIKGVTRFVAEYL